MRRFGLVTPYLGEVQAAHRRELRAAPVSPAVAERHLGEHDNFAFSEVSEATVAQMIRAVAAARPDAVTVFCTNLRGAGVVAALEAETGVPVYDTVATGLWQGLRLAGADPRRIAGWGAPVRPAGVKLGWPIRALSQWPVGTGVVPLEQIRSLSGLEFLGAIAAGRLPAAPISAVLGFRLVEVGARPRGVRGRSRSARSTIRSARCMAAGR